MISASGEGLTGCFREVVGADAGGIELPKQGECLLPHRLLDERQLAHLRKPESGVEPVGLGVDGVLAAGFPQQRSQLGPGKA